MFKPGVVIPQHLAYVEWYTAPMLTIQQQNIHNMATVSKGPPIQNGHCLWSIIPLSNIRQSCMLTPNFALVPISDQSSWTTLNILDTAPSFFVNNWSSIYTKNNTAPTSHPTTYYLKFIL